MSALPTESVPFSELLRSPTETADRLIRARVVRLRRRDAADLVLMSAERADAEGEVIEVAARLMAGVAHRAPALVGEVLPAVLPWTRFLPPDDLAQFAEEFVAVAEAAGMVGNMAPVSQLLLEWRHTAEIHADPVLYEALTSRPLGDYGAVPRPVDE